MKMFALIAALFVAVAANAGTTASHDYDGALRGIAIDNACVTEKEVKTIKPMKTCTKLVPVETDSGDGYVFTDWVCEKWQVSQVAYPRAFSRTVCTNWGSGNGENYEGCLKYGEKADFLPNTISVTYSTSQGEYDSEVTKKHTFPACK